MRKLKFDVCYYTVVPRHRYFELLVFRYLDDAKAYADKIKAKSSNSGEGYYILKGNIDKPVKIAEWFVK